MKVSECKKCRFFEHRIWSTTYTPKGYHTIGVSHAYGYCKKCGCRCLNVKKCEEEK